MIDLHTHTIFSDGELIPSELIRRAKMHGYRAIALTDHADYTNLEYVIEGACKAKYLEDIMDMRIFAGVELTHVPPEKIAPLALKAKKLGADIVVVHGETVVEPVAQGTNKAAVILDAVDILAHPGFITIEEAIAAKENNVCIELTARKGHNTTNGHVARITQEVGATLIVNTDTHSPNDLITKEFAKSIAMGAGLTKSQAEKVLKASLKFID